MKGYSRFLFVAVLLLSNKTSFCQTLEEALNKEDTVMVLKMVKEGADLNKYDSSGLGPLMTPSRWGKYDMVNFLLRQGVLPDARRSPAGRTPLIVACAYYGGINVVKLLVSYGADVNATANDGSTPLMLAAANAKQTVVEWLLKNGAHAEARDKAGKTALDYARASDDIAHRVINSVKDGVIDKEGTIQVLEDAMKEGKR